MLDKSFFYDRVLGLHDSLLHSVLGHGDFFKHTGWSKKVAHFWYLSFLPY